MDRQRIFTQAKGPDDAEKVMKKASLVVSLVGLGLMIIGFIGVLIDPAPLSVPGASVLPLPTLMHLSQSPASLVTMSVGIVLLALLPTVRVALALWYYIRRRDALNTVAALIVVIELLLSIRTGD
jgi:uncharacterized membrane protein